ncbi:MAG: hypothetical protein V7707_05750 [Motiliproteus sp.]
MDIAEFKARLKAKMAENRQAFEGRYGAELDQLMGLSREEIDEITPDTTDLQAYDNLITLVKEATRVNLSQAQLKAEIQALGDVAVTIAEKVPRLAGLFV